MGELRLDASCIRRPTCRKRRLLVRQKPQVAPQWGEHAGPVTWHRWHAAVGRRRTYARGNGCGGCEENLTPREKTLTPHRLTSSPRPSSACFSLGQPWRQRSSMLVWRPSSGAMRVSVTPQPTSFSTGRQTVPPPGLRAVSGLRAHTCACHPGSSPHHPHAGCQPAGRAWHASRQPEGTPDGGDKRPS